jgi:hypothetical protein
VAKKKHWKYLNAATCRLGTMVCITCGQVINVGQYRSYETEEAYHPQHRKCSSDDPKWLALDAESAREVPRLQQQLAAYQAFRMKWDETALDEEIAGMEASLRRLATSASHPNSSIFTSS